MTLQWSYDYGRTWVGALPIWGESSAYSALTAHPAPSSPHVFLLFEKGLPALTLSLQFVRIGL